MIDDDASEVSAIDRARSGDARAFNELLRPHRDKLWAVCLRVTGNRTDAEDAVQECIIAIWRGLPRFRGESQFSTWIYRIAANAALGIARRRKEVPIEEIFDVPLTSGFEDAIALHDEIQAALRTVPEDFRIALVLREYGGLTYEEIARHQGVPIQTVKSRLNRARSAVRAALTVE